MRDSHSRHPRNKGLKRTTFPIHFVLRNVIIPCTPLSLVWHSHTSHVKRREVWSAYIASQSCAHRIFNYIGDEYRYQSAKAVRQVYKASKLSKNVSRRYQRYYMAFYLQQCTNTSASGYCRVEAFYTNSRK